MKEVCNYYASKMLKYKKRTSFNPVEACSLKREKRVSRNLPKVKVLQ